MTQLICNSCTAKILRLMLHLCYAISYWHIWPNVSNPRKCTRAHFFGKLFTRHVSTPFIDLDKSPAYSAQSKRKDGGNTSGEPVAKKMKTGTGVPSPGALDMTNLLKASTKPVTTSSTGGKLLELRNNFFLTPPVDVIKRESSSYSDLHKETARLLHSKFLSHCSSDKDKDSKLYYFSHDAMVDMYDELLMQPNVTVPTLMLDDNVDAQSTYSLEPFLTFEKKPNSDAAMEVGGHLQNMMVAWNTIQQSAISLAKSCVACSSNRELETRLEQKEEEVSRLK